MSNFKSQIKGITGSAIKRIAQEPAEIGKTAVEQVVGTENVSGQPAPTKTSASGQPPQIKPSREEGLKSRILAAYRRELEEEIARQRQERLQKIEEQKIMEEKKVEEEKKQEKEKRETFWQKGWRLATGKLRRRVETRLPKAA